MDAAPSRPLSVVTGGSSGIGLELAKQFISHGYDVVIAGRSTTSARAELGAHDGATVYNVDADLATSAGVDALCERVDKIGRPVQALALNAGMGVGGEFVATDLDAEVKMIELNCIAVVKIAKHFVPRMIERHQGRVLITSSIAGNMPAPYEAVYGATKAFDLSFAEGLRDELRGTGVTVTAVQPGPTDTKFFERAGLEDTKVGQDKKDDPAQVAEQAYDAMIKGKDKIYAGSIGTRLRGLASELLPEPFKARKHRKMTKPGSGKKEE